MTSERDKNDKKLKHIPKDAQVIMSILKELGINDYEPRVINQLLEFTYRYVTCILDDAKLYTNHAKKKLIDLDDVKLATQLVLDKAFTSPPQRDVLMELARGRNIAPLPLIKTHCGLRLPPDRYCLIAANYKLKTVAPPPKRMTKSAIDKRSTIKTQISQPASSTPGSSNKKINANSGGSGSAKPQVVTIPKPVFKFSNTPKTTTSTASTGGGAATSSSTGGTSSATPLPPLIKTKTEIKIEDFSSSTISGGATTKRKREDDEFFN